MSQFPLQVVWGHACSSGWWNVLIAGGNDACSRPWPRDHLSGLPMSFKVCTTGKKTGFLSNCMGGRG